MTCPPQLLSSDHFNLFMKSHYLPTGLLPLASPIQSFLLNLEMDFPGSTDPARSSFAQEHSFVHCRSLIAWWHPNSVSWSPVPSPPSDAWWAWPGNQRGKSMNQRSLGVARRKEGVGFLAQFQQKPMSDGGSGLELGGIWVQPGDEEREVPVSSERREWNGK